MNGNGEIFRRLQDVLVRLSIVRDPSSLRADADLLEQYGVDSMKVVLLLVELEREFGFEMDPNAITQRTITYLPDLIAFVERGMRGRDPLADAREP